MFLARLSDPLGCCGPSVALSVTHLDPTSAPSTSLEIEFNMMTIWSLRRRYFNRLYARGVKKWWWNLFSPLFFNPRRSPYPHHHQHLGFGWMRWFGDNLSKIGDQGFRKSPLTISTQSSESELSNLEASIVSSPSSSSQSSSVSDAGTWRGYEDKEVDRGNKKKTKHQENIVTKRSSMTSSNSSEESSW